MNHKKILVTAGILGLTVALGVFSATNNLLYTFIATAVALTLSLGDIYLVELWFRYLQKKKEIKTKSKAGGKNDNNNTA